ncbi:ABC transporter permease [candidate division KSB1 bacterium]|nr:ABC transporter permease [candidate division KSB1 bacterium]RQW04191.1 MAG: ABC transporter permease [candidate division KSB1 bacterium]
MIIPKLAIRNLLGAGVRTWLNVIVLSIAFFAIVFMQGLYIGMNEQARDALIDTYYGGGQYWQKNYDPFDPFALEDSHAPVPGELQQLVDAGQATPILMVQATSFPSGRIVPAMLIGISPEQQVINIPADVLKRESDAIPALIGTRMAKSARLNSGDYLTIRWRDANGTYDAADVQIVHIMQTTVEVIDAGKVWIPLETLQQVASMPNEATIVVTAKNYTQATTPEGWNFKNHDFLLADLKALVKQKTVGASILYVMLLFLGMLAIFDTQVLSIFRRQKEIGTLIALGMTRSKVIRLFTLEGALHGLLAAVVGFMWGSPLLWLMAKNGWPMPEYGDDFGMALGEAIYPMYTGGLILGTTILVLFAVTIVSFLPTRRIAKLRPTDALRGKRA